MSNRSIREPGHVLALPRVAWNAAGLDLADRHHELFTVAGELVDLLVATVGDPDVFLRVVWIHEYPVEFGEKVVVPRPRLDELAGAIEDDHVMLGLLLDSGVERMGRVWRSLHAEGAQSPDVGCDPFPHQAEVRHHHDPVG